MAHVAPLGPICKTCVDEGETGRMGSTYRGLMGPV